MISLDYQGGKQVRFRNGVTKQHQLFDDFRFGLTVVFIVAGIYMHVTSPFSIGQSNRRIFQAVYDEDFGVDAALYDGYRMKSTFGHNEELDLLTFNEEERRHSLVVLGNKCLPRSFLSERQLYFNIMTGANPVLERYDDIGRLALAQKESTDDKSDLHKQLLEIQLELWKFCMIGSGFASTFVDYRGLHFLDHIDNILEFGELNKNFVTVTTTHALQRDPSTVYMSSAFLSLRSQQGKDTAKLIVGSIMMADVDTLNTLGNGQWLSRELYHHVYTTAKSHPKQFTILKSSCHHLHVSADHLHRSTSQSFSLHTGACTIDGLSPCCQITKVEEEEERAVLLMEHPKIDSPFSYNPIEQNKQNEVLSTKIDIISADQEGPPTTKATRAFDIFLGNDCLPSWTCQVCLVRYHNQPENNLTPCGACMKECTCYCRNICRSKPNRNHVSKELIVTPPKVRNTSNRLIPRIISQTYFEPITKEKYPNFSRLVASWQSSGWEYKFYDDDASQAFLDEHFPPEVREAYDSILPGAYKADLFRLCVLLIHGGVYSDVDVELTTDLDSMLDDDVGFIIPVDEPGRQNGMGSCMWNGLMASSPGHPFIAKAVELIVNQIRNRFTAVDIDNMLCPNVALDHSHAWDLLFVTGPCIIGAAINAVLGNHMQAHIVPGTLNTSTADVDIPGRSIILSQNKADMGWHRFTYLEKNVIVAGTDCPDYDDRGNQNHYSDKPPHIKMALFGTKALYKDFNAKGEDIKIQVRR